MTDEGSISGVGRACPNCGLLIRAKALQCVHCREWIRDERAAPPQPTSASPENGSDAGPAVSGPRAAYSRGQLPVHLVTLWVLTLGAYSFYWFYRNWRDLAEITDDEIHPGLRTLGLVVPFLNIYLAYQHFRLVGELTAADGDRLGYDPGVLTALFFSLVAVGNLFALWPVSLLAALVTVPVQSALNRIWARREDGLPVRESFEMYEVAIMMAGLLLTLGGLAAM
ncbi:MAG: DUF4234 domain-containing protein [Myxococcales bacterium]|jgi:hypothetical protein|nr:MAG: DUF4234 domain-containing protein [Myxococcales bacterium]